MPRGLQGMFRRWGTLERDDLLLAFHEFMGSRAYETFGSCLNQIFMLFDAKGIAVDEGLLQQLLKDALKAGHGDNVDFVLRRAATHRCLEKGRCLWLAAWLGKSFQSLLRMIELGYSWTDGYTKEELVRFVGESRDPVLVLVRSDSRDVMIAQVLFELGFPFESAQLHLQSYGDLADVTDDMQAFVTKGPREKREFTAGLRVRIDHLLVNSDYGKARRAGLQHILVLIAAKYRAQKRHELCAAVEIWGIIALHVYGAAAWHRVSYASCRAFLSN